MRPRRSLSFGVNADCIADPGVKSPGFCTPRLSAVLLFACVYVYASVSIGDDAESAMLLTVPARFRGGGCNDGEFDDPSVLNLKGTLSLVSSRDPLTELCRRPGMSFGGVGLCVASIRCRSLSGRILRSGGIECVSVEIAGVLVRGVSVPRATAAGDMGRSIA